MSELHTRIKERLQALGKSYRQASIDSGMSPDAINKMLQNPNQSQTLETVRKLAIGLDTTPEWLAFAADPVVIENKKPGPTSLNRVRPKQEVFLLRGTVEKLNSSSIAVDREALVRGIFGSLSSLAPDPGTAKELARVLLKSLLGETTEVFRQAEALLAHILPEEPTQEPRRRRAQ